MSNQDAQHSTGDRRVVLIVDDEAPLAEALAMVVEDAGYEALVASQGQQGLALARQYRPALVITDMMMPHLDGAGLIAALQDDAARDSHAAPPVILLTAGGIRLAEQAGATLVLRKPFDIGEIERLLHRFLGAPPTASSMPESPDGT